MLAFQHNLAALNDAVRRYQLYTGLSTTETLWKQGTELGWFLYKRLRALKPDKGEIRASAMRRLERGQGIQVRPAIRERVYSKRGARSNVATHQVLFGKGNGVASLLRKGKRLNLQALAVQAEINVRERASGFLSISSVRPRRGIPPTAGVRSWSRFGPILGEAGLHPFTNGATLRFEWGGFSKMSEGAAEGMGTPKGMDAVIGATADAVNNIQTYLDRKLTEGIKSIFR